MKLGMIGLGRMGGNMTERLRQRGHEVIGYDAFSEATQVSSLEELVAAIGDSGSRVAWVMVPAGEPTEDVINRLAELFGPGDLVIDGGNSYWRDSVRRGETLAGKGIGFIDCGTSGGVWGLEFGYALMVGGTRDDVARAQPLFDALTPDDGGFGHVGPVGAGHYTKMVHNGIEYGMMQAFAEGYEILGASELGIDVLAAMESWQQGSVVRSWLLDLAVDGLKKYPGLEGIAPVAKDSGEGRWTVEEAVRLGVPANVIAASLWSRFLSQKESQAMRMIAMMRAQFGGHAIVPGPEPPDVVARTEKGTPS